MKLPDRLVKLEYSEHARERLIERTTGTLILAPQYIRFTKDNTIDIIVRNNRIIQATIHIEYKKGVEMYLPIMVSTGIVKTVYFKNVKKNSTKARKTSEVSVKTEDTSTERTGSPGITQHVEDISRDMGRKENRWEKLFRNLRKVFRF